MGSRTTNMALPGAWQRTWCLLPDAAQACTSVFCDRRWSMDQAARALSPACCIGSTRACARRSRTRGLADPWSRGWDLVNAILLATGNKPANGKVFIITDGEDYSTRRIYEAMQTAFGRPVPTWSLPAWLLRSLGKAGDLYGKAAGRPALFDSAVCSRLLDSACYRSGSAAADLDFRPG